MPTSRTAKHRGTVITFTEDDHRYRTDNIPDFLSGTGFIKLFFPAFDGDRIAQEKAEREGLDPEELKAEWKAKGDEACLLGTRVHDNCEAQMLGEPLPNLQPRHDKERAMMKQGYLLVEKLKAKFQFKAAEQIVFSERLKIAGTMDLLMEGRKKSDTLWIMDYKTNAEIKTTGFNGASAFAPFTHLPDCNFTKYALQLSLYELIMRLEQYIRVDQKVGRILWHITEEGYKPILVPDYSAEVAKMILLKEVIDAT